MKGHPEISRYFPLASPGLKARRLKLKRILGAIGSLALVLGLAAALEEKADAAIVMNLTEENGNLLLTMRGSVMEQGDLERISLVDVSTPFAAFEPASATLVGGVGHTFLMIYSCDNATGPQSFGGHASFSLSTTGDNFGIFGSFGDDGQTAIALPYEYGWGTFLSNTTLVKNITFAELGITAGTYVWTWGSGSNADSATLIIGEAAPGNEAIPEPSTVGLLGLGVLWAMVLRSRRANLITCQPVQ